MRSTYQAWLEGFAAEPRAPARRRTTVFTDTDLDIVPPQLAEESRIAQKADIVHGELEPDRGAGGEFVGRIGPADRENDVVALREASQPGPDRRGDAARGRRQGDRHGREDAGPHEDVGD